MIKISSVKFILTVCFVSILTGCASKPERIYAWGSYEENIYKYFNSQGEVTQEMLDQMTQELDVIDSSSQRVPPGMHAFIGLLHEKSGNVNMMSQSFKREKDLFPESAGYIEFLMRNLE
jgi:hypothetical protein